MEEPRRARKGQRSRSTYPLRCHRTRETAYHSAVKVSAPSKKSNGMQDYFKAKRDAQLRQVKEAISSRGHGRQGLHRWVLVETRQRMFGVAQPKVAQLNRCHERNPERLERGVHDVSLRIKGRGALC